MTQNQNLFNTLQDHAQMMAQTTLDACINLRQVYTIMDFIRMVYQRSESIECLLLFSAYAGIFDCEVLDEDTEILRRLYDQDPLGYDTLIRMLLDCYAMWIIYYLVTDQYLFLLKEYMEDEC